MSCRTTTLHWLAGADALLVRPRSAMARLGPAKGLPPDADMAADAQPLAPTSAGQPARRR